VTEACDIAIQVHGGNGFTREYEVVNYWPLLRLIKTAPVSREMILNYVGEHVLGFRGAISVDVGVGRRPSLGRPRWTVRRPHAPRREFVKL